MDSGTADKELAHHDHGQAADHHSHPQADVGEALILGGKGARKSHQGVREADPDNFEGFRVGSAGNNHALISAQGTQGKTQIGAEEGDEQENTEQGDKAEEDKLGKAGGDKALGPLVENSNKVTFLQQGYVGLAAHNADVDGVEHGHGQNAGE